MFLTVKSIIPKLNLVYTTNNSKNKTNRELFKLTATGQKKNNRKEIPHYSFTIALNLTTDAYIDMIIITVRNPS